MLSALTPPLATERRLHQCVLLAPFDVLFFYLAAAENVWLDNLLLRMDRRGSFGATLVRCSCLCASSLLSPASL